MINDANILEIDLSIIRENIKILKGKFNNKFYAVVKANAYGLGAIEIANNIEDIVDTFCVANINEAIELRKNGIDKDILIFGYIHPDNYKFLNEYNLIATIYDYGIAKSMNDLGHSIRGHLKIETGHNRLGFKDSDDSISEIKEIFKMDNLHIEGVFSHFSSADEADSNYTNRQEEIFEDSLKRLKPFSNQLIKHISNDAGVIAYKYPHDAIRSGISMYGMYPSDYMKDNYEIGIECSFTWKSKISFIKNIEEGEAISYGRKFISDKKMRVATISVGYADGYHRLISNKGYVLINGKRANILGVITMDQMMVDISDIDCKLHDDVILIGKSGEEIISPELVANWAETISYEVMTSISNRVSRVYLI